ncbi:hypothetical protein GCM10011609_37560 [Lentzea pudingi]|uniref:Uncharacterized protein n=1 Tax=Lentzea pudingi TaxID=1789439 RepID=A0ABQ2HZR6_9PSEU|nr:hypothetical protein GCM10011609_37560 [Lentzea pudingi]
MAGRDTEGSAFVINRSHSLRGVPGEAPRTQRVESGGGRRQRNHAWRRVNPRRPQDHPKRSSVTLGDRSCTPEVVVASRSLAYYPLTPDTADGDIELRGHRLAGIHQARR